MNVLWVATLAQETFDKQSKPVIIIIAIGGTAFLCLKQGSRRVETLNRISDSNLKAAFFIEGIL